MSKTGWIILIICLLLVVCIAVGLVLAHRIFNAMLSRASDTDVDSSATQGYRDLKNSYSADGVYTVSMKDLKELNIDWISGSVTVELTDGEAVRFVETAEKAIQEKDALRFGESNGTLRIQACRKGYIGKLPEKHLTVYLPRSLANGLSELEIDTVSAAVSAGDLKLSELEIDTVSGQVKLTKLDAEEVQVDSVSGAVSVLDCALDSLRIDTVSGKTTVSGSVQTLKASTVSGSVTLDPLTCGRIKVNTMSGAITMTLTQTPRELQVDTTSGKTQIALPTDAACSIQLDSMSGKLYLNGEVVSTRQITLGEGGPSFDIDSMSGSVYVITK